MHEWKLAEVRYNIVRERHYEVAILPIGSTEPHGLHLPYGTDNFEVESLAEQACEKAHADGARVVLLPTIPYGVTTNQMEFPLAISIDPSTLNAVVTDIVQSVEHHGIRKLIVLNGHGGNNFNALLRELYRKTQVFIVWIDGWQIPQGELRAGFDHVGEHADEMETSWMLHLRPDLVFMGDCDDGAVREPRIQAMREGWAWYVRPWEKLTRNSGFGDPRRASAQKGAAHLDACVDSLAKFIVDFSQADIDGKFPY